MLLGVVAILAPIAACVLVFFALFLVVRANNRLAAIQRQQTEEFARLRHAINQLRQPPVGEPSDEQVGELPTIGAPARILQAGDQVEIIDGLDGGKLGTIAPSPEWLPEGAVCVELTGGQGPRYVEVSKVARLDEAGRG